MIKPLYGAFMKLKRADQHIRALHKRIETFIESNPYRIVVEHRHHPIRKDLPELRREDVVGMGKTFVTIRARVVQEPRIVEWGVLIGDVIHNLRSALDHLVWDLTRKHSGRPPPDPIPKANPWRNVGFPIIPIPTDWHSGLQKIWGVPPGLKADFKALQPFSTSPNRPEQEPLAVLQELWNIDKHRHVHLVGTILQAPRRVPELPAFAGPGGMFSGLGARIVRRRRLGPFKDNAKLIELVLMPYLMTPEAIEKYVDMYLRFTFDVAFAKGPPAYGGRIMKTLQSIYDTTAAILIRFEPELR